MDAEWGGFLVDFLFFLDFHNRIYIFVELTLVSITIEITVVVFLMLNMSMKQITKSLAVGLFLVSSSLSGSPTGHDSPPYHRLRTWAEIHSVTKSVSKKTVKSKVAVLPTMPGYAVQLGAFSSRSNAENLVLTLQKKGVQNIYYHQKNIGGRTFHKVVVGPFRERKNATQRWSLIRRAYHLNEGFVTAI